MSTTPAECQPLADQVAALEQQYQAKAAEAAALEGAAAWSALADLGRLLQQLDDAEAALAQCVATHTAALTGQLAVMDASGGPPGAGQTVTLWDVTAAPTPVESAAVQDGAFGFDAAIPARAAITLQTPVDGGVAAVDFRSGELDGMPADASRIETVVLPEYTLSATAANQWAGAYQPTPEQTAAAGAGALGSGSAHITSVSVSFADGTVTLAASGTIDATALIGSMPIPVASALPFSAQVTVSIVPARAPTGDDIVTVALAGDQPLMITFQSNVSAFANILTALRGVLSPFVASIAQQAISNWLHDTLPGEIARGLALAGLPPDTRISLRSLTIGAQGITFQPVLGAFGDALSTYHPQPLPPPAPA